MSKVKNRCQRSVSSWTFWRASHWEESNKDFNVSATFILWKWSITDLNVNKFAYRQLFNSQHPTLSPSPPSIYEPFLLSCCHTLWQVLFFFNNCWPLDTSWLSEIFLFSLVLSSWDLRTLLLWTKLKCLIPTKICCNYGTKAF